jgi:hypothetical protein
MGYGDEITMNVRSGLQARINQLRIGGGKGLMLDTPHSVPAEDLFHSPCLLELKQLVNDDEKAFLMGLILIRLYEHHESGRMPGRPGLKHLTLIEEAHRLLRNVASDKGSDVFANPKGHSIELFTNILSEIRAFGEGIVISEQIPSKLVPDAIKNTNLKIVHRLLPEDDRKLMAGAMGLQEAQSRYLSGLAVGEAVASAETLPKAVLIAVPLSPTKTPAATVTDYALYKRMSLYWQAHAEVRLRFAGCGRCLDSGKKQDCSVAESRLQDWSLQRALAQCLSAMIHNASFVAEAFADLTLVLDRFAEPTRPVSPYCVLVTYLAKELDAMGSLYGWSYSDVDKTIELSAAAAWNLAESEDPALVVRQFSGLVEHLCERDKGPLPGCHVCELKCAFRYESQHLARQVPPHAGDFCAAYRDPHNQVEDLAHLAWVATADCTREGDVATRIQTALCFAVQQFDDLGLPSFSQHDAARVVYARLQQIGRLGHG